MEAWGPDNARAIGGGFAVIVLAWAMSGFRRPPLRVALTALALEIVLVLVMFGAPPVRSGLMSLSGAVDALANATRAGTSFVFGYVGGGPPPFYVPEPANLGNLAFQALPLILVVSALSAVLWHWRILQFVCGVFAFLFRRLLSLSGAASLSVAANIFLGMVESPILVRPYLERITRTELFIVMTAGLATVAGTVLVIYATMLEPFLPGATAHVVAASIMNAPAAILIGAVMVPHRGGPPAPPTPIHAEQQSGHASTVDALVTGVSDGLKLYLNVLAMLIVFVALVALVNGVLALAPDIAGAPLSVERMFGWIFRPVTWAIGVPWAEAGPAGALYGVKTVLNEFIAYERLAALGDLLSPRTSLIMTYALCGFANFGSLGIMLAGLVTMAPGRRAEILELGPRSLVAGSLATLLTGAIIAALPATFFGLE